MGLRIYLEDEYGDEVAALDETRLLNSFLPDFEDEAFEQLPYIDLEGETIFGAFQAPALLTDLATLQARLPEYPDVVELLEEIRVLARRVAEDARLRLRFSGR
jgi:hypothetical protein